MPRRALLSVSDKAGIEGFASVLARQGFTIISTGRTAAAIERSGISVLSVERLTGVPPLFSGRVKTLHPALLGGILLRRGDVEHEKQAKELGIEPIDLVVVNVYPFGETLRRLRAESRDSDEGMADLVEQIDIGGPTLLRAAAKNWESVAAVCDPADYDRVCSELTQRGEISISLRRELAAKVFTRTAAYDALVAEVLSRGGSGGVIFTGGRPLRYGENPHQWGKFYELHQPGSSHESPGGAASDELRAMSKRQSTLPRSSKLEARSLPVWHQLQGKDMSYLNILDSDAAWRMACEFTEPTAVFVKHANPSGIASHPKIEEAFQRAYDADKLSAFGVIIALNRTCTADIAKRIIDQKIFTEVLLAPSFDQAALEILKAKPNMRVLDMDSVDLSAEILYRSAFGGMLVQNDDARIVTEADLKTATKKEPTTAQIADLLFAWKVVKHTKSNAIVFAKDRVTIGIGSGQTNRVDATWIAAKRAGAKARGAVMASDAFFPFPDSVEEATKHGISAIIQPGGSIRDQEVIAKADELGIAMVLTGVRAFRH